MGKRLVWTALGLSVAVGGCATHTKGSWACAIERGGVCSSISDIDHDVLRGAPSKHASAPEPDPVIDGAIPAKLWSTAGWSAGPISGAPARAGEATVKVAIAPWIDTAGDYHAGAEVYAVMRQGGWFVAPAASTRRVQLSAAPSTPQSAPNAENRSSAGPAGDPAIDLAKFAPVAVGPSLAAPTLVTRAGAAGKGG